MTPRDIVGAVSKVMRCSTSSSLPSLTAVELRLVGGSLRSLSSLGSGLGVSLANGVKLPGRQKSKGLYPAASSSLLSVRHVRALRQALRTMSRV